MTIVLSLEDQRDLPAARVKPAGSLLWLLDEAAAASLGDEYLS